MPSHTTPAVALRLNCDLTAMRVNSEAIPCDSLGRESEVRLQICSLRWNVGLQENHVALHGSQVHSQQAIF